MTTENEIKEKANTILSILDGLTFGDIDRIMTSIANNTAIERQQESSKMKFRAINKFMPPKEPEEPPVEKDKE